MNRKIKRSLSLVGAIVTLALLLLRRSIFVSASTSALLSTSSSLSQNSAISYTAPYSADQVLVKFKRSASQKVIQQYLNIQNAQAQVSPELAALGVMLLKVPPGKVPQVVANLKGASVIEFAEPNYLVQAVDTLPNDPNWGNQYGPINIQAPQAWDITTGSSSVTIAVIDTGVDLDHPDLAAKIWNNPGEVGTDSNGNDKRANNIDDDGDSYVDDWRGWDFANGDNQPQDDNGHGTHVSGIAAAEGNNSVGIAGVSWGARVMPLKVLDSGGGGSESDVAGAMIWAANHGAKVINLSLGGSSPSSVMEAAVNYAYTQGVTVVAAAGNSGLPGVLYPAAYPNVIAVASTDVSNNHSWFSSYGSEVDIAAPGSNIYSTYWNGTSTYTWLSGTSMATPHVAGVTALLAGLPQFNTPDKIRAALQNTALDLGDIGWDEFYGYGLVQAYNALLFDPTSITPTPAPISYTLSTSLICPPGVDFNWLSAANGSNTNLKQDDGFVSVSLPFPFVFNGQTKTSAYISTNGYLTFGSNATAYDNASIPTTLTPNDFIAPFWDDLNPAVGGNIYHATFGSAPNRQFVVEWNGIPRWVLFPPYGNGSLTFQLILSEGSNDIIFQYLNLSGSNASGGSATVGIEFVGGANGVQYAYNTPGSLQNGMAIKFSPTIGDIPTSTPTCAPTATPTATVTPTFWTYYLPLISK